MTSDVAEMISVTIQFKPEFCYDLMTRFDFSLKYSRVPSHDKTSKKVPDLLQTTIKLPDSDGTYQWLMQHSDSLKVIAPQSVRLNLKSRPERALAALNAA